MNFYNSPEFQKLKSFLDYHIDTITDTDKVYTFPLMCGAGKSTYIKYRIADTLQKGQDGLIVVTDAIDRLKEYTDMQEIDSGLDLDYLSRIRDKVAILTSDTIAEELRTQKKKPILLMSTQRYFSLTREEIKSYIDFYDGKRSKIIFDEKPYFAETIRITMDTINGIDTALHEAIDDTADVLEKAWSIHQWEVRREKIQNVIADYENQLRQDKKSQTLEIWYADYTDVLTEDNERFFPFIECHRQKLNKYDISVYKNLLAVNQLVEDGAAFVSQKKKSGEYANYFTVILDNADKLRNVGASVFVLDGTADVSPDYELAYIEQIDCSEFNRSLSNLVINCVDIPTSQNKLCRGKESEPLIECIRSYINTFPQKPQVLFTYQKIIKKFMDVEKRRHLGAIKGSNQYRECTHIVQVGMNRFPDIVYKQRTYFNKLSRLTHNNLKGQIVLGRNAPVITMYKALLEDFEQNLFRSKIRNYDCDEQVMYTLLLNTGEYSAFIDMIRERYCALGASVNVLEAPDIIKESKSKSRKVKNRTKVQKIFDWIDAQPEGMVFKLSVLLEGCGLKNEQFQTARKKSPVLRNRFEQMKTNTKGYYCIRRNNVVNSL